MFKKFNQLNDSLKALKDLERKLNDVDMSNPQLLLESMGVNLEDVENSFNENFTGKVELKYFLDSDNKEPEYAYPTDSGFDLRSNVDISLEPFGRALVPTGIHFDVPLRCEIQVRPKSGLAIKRGLSVLNTPGTVDYGYTGEIKVIVFNMSNEVQNIFKGDKIAQAVICPVVQGGEVELKRVNKIDDKDRNTNGFGSTGN
jgi:dUTP pyrophosphatase|tara:strand:+ start:88 stop:687 length:600 start_codon:yes stop_codon:yes gene_type:complete